MILRRWQAEAIDLAIQKFRRGGRHFLVLATPGAGKTTMSSVLTEKLFQLDLIDLVVCVTPSVIVQNGFQKALSFHTGQAMHGGLGAKGCVLTYQALGHLTEDFWQTFDSNRVLVIFDEVHHCSGTELSPGNSWGQTIILRIKSKAEFTLSLSGTPWRSDNLPVVLVNYDSMGQVAPDFVYGLQAALDDGICRKPNIIAIDNSAISVKSFSPSSENIYDGISDFLSESQLPYQKLLDCQNLILHMLQKTLALLTLLKKSQSDAAALIVASNVSHAHKIYDLLTNVLNQDAVIVNHQTPRAAEIISEFRTSNINWLVSVGMVSEGTDIPRLQVCCHLTRIKTELHFRQLLGRVLRARSGRKEIGYMVILAEAELTSFAERVLDDLPRETSVLEFCSPASDPDDDYGIGTSDADFHETSSTENSSALELESRYVHLEDITTRQTDDSEVSIFGSFMEQLILLKDSVCAGNPII